MMYWKLITKTFRRKEMQIVEEVEVGLRKKRDRMREEILALEQRVFETHDLLPIDPLSAVSKKAKTRLFSSTRLLLP
jgi:hypothetical protein